VNTNQPVSNNNIPIPWWAALIESVVAFVLGILLLFHGKATPLVLLQFLGIYFLVKGLLALAAIFTNPRGWFLKFMIGFLGLVVGIILLDHPFWRSLQNETNLVYILAGVAFAIGVITLFQVFVGGGFSTVFLGLISMVIGLILVWAPSFLIIPSFIGLLLIATGVILMVKSLSLFYALPGQPEVIQKAVTEQLEAEPKLVEDTSPVRTSASMADVSEYTYPEVVDNEQGGVSVEQLERVGEVQEELSGSDLSWATGDSRVDEEVRGLPGSGVAATGMAVAAINLEENQADFQAHESPPADLTVEYMVANEAEKRFETDQETSNLETDFLAVKEEQTMLVDENEDSAPTEFEIPTSPEPSQENKTMPPEEEQDVIAAQQPVASQTVDLDLGEDETRYLNQDISYVEGIGPVFAEKFKSVGVLTTLDLLKRGSTRKGRSDLVSDTGISPKLILRWVNQADLFRIKGIGSEYAELLEAAGVDTVVELSGRNPENLHMALLSANEDKKLVRKTPTLPQVQDWVGQASQLPRIIKY
jgi:uncharacterized membrane protein HdeD (DUF308 family)/predicted flap endonuclease-1-like 5' DNA nuclease